MLSIPPENSCKRGFMWWVNQSRLYSSVFSSQINIHFPLLKLIKYLFDRSDLLPTVPILLDIYFLNPEMYEQVIYSVFFLVLHMIA